MLVRKYFFDHLFKIDDFNFQAVMVKRVNKEEKVCLDSLEEKDLREMPDLTVYQDSQVSQSDIFEVSNLRP